MKNRSPRTPTPSNALLSPGRSTQPSASSLNRTTMPVGIPQHHRPRPVTRNRAFLLLNYGFLLLLLAGLIGFALWSWFGSLEESVNGMGELVPEAHMRKVMAPGNGTITQLAVQENQRVKAGQLLMTLDPEVNDIQQTMLMKELALIHEETSALRAAAQGDERKANLDGTHNAWLQAARTAKQSEMAAARSQIEKSQHYYKQAKEQVANMETLVASREKLLEQYRSLQKEGGLSERDMLNYEHQVMEQKTQLARAREEVEAHAAELAQVMNRPVALEAEYKRDLLSRLTEQERSLVNLSGEAAKNTAFRKNMRITAPIDGIVNQQAVHGEGEVVSAGSVLLSLVPRDIHMLAEVRVANKELAYIHEGQRVGLRLDAFPVHQFGRLYGKIVEISPSSVPDKDGHPFFIVRIRPEKPDMVSVDGKHFPFRSGMTVSADMITREKNILSFFTEPMHYHFDRAFRDPTNN
jgi:HlyD family type I secretion membrane fusion protein